MFPQDVSFLEENCKTPSLLGGVALLNDERKSPLTYFFFLLFKRSHLKEDSVVAFLRLEYFYSNGKEFKRKMSTCFFFFSENGLLYFNTHTPFLIAVPGKNLRCVDPNY